ncbi:MAG TPA: enoyl-CoA hydratase [Usitatibacter sp.]|nr:enoyl-CoA hydratase [Usitatibacter sp.]
MNDLDPPLAPSGTAYASPTERVKAWLEGPILHVRFNNPARHNALSVDMWEAVPRLLAQAEADEAVRCVVFSGEGGKSFISGADISQFEDMRAQKEAVKKYERLAEEALEGIYDFPKPTIACIKGYCVGGGVNVAIACDIRLASTDSTFFVPATRLGLGYRMSAMRNLTNLVGPGYAKDIFFTARRLDAKEADKIGLVNRIAEPEGLEALLGEYTDAISTGAPLTIKAGKRIIRELLKTDGEPVDMELCRKLILDCFESEDYMEGRRAFMEKRPPSFRGK